MWDREILFKYPPRFSGCHITIFLRWRMWCVPLNRVTYPLVTMSPHNTTDLRSLTSRPSSLERACKISGGIFPLLWGLFRGSGARGRKTTLVCLWKGDLFPFFFLYLLNQRSSSKKTKLYRTPLILFMGSWRGLMSGITFVDCVGESQEVFWAQKVKINQPKDRGNFRIGDSKLACRTYCESAQMDGGAILRTKNMSKFLCLTFPAAPRHTHTSSFPSSSLLFHASNGFLGV